MNALPEIKFFIVVWLQPTAYSVYSDIDLVVMVDYFRLNV